jgi:hypothetical protein
MATLFFSSCWSHYWTFSSSFKMAQICVVLSNNSMTSLTSFAILAIWSAYFCSLCSRTSEGVIGLIFSLSSLISFLYPSIVYEIICIFSAVLLSGACVLSGMQLYTIFMPYSSLSMCSFSSSFSEFSWSHVIYNISVTPLPISKLIASTQALDCTSCIMLA